MELLKPNYIDTTTAIEVNSNTDGAENIMNPDVTFQHVSSGLNDDLTHATYRINFEETVSVSRIALAELNWKQFNIYHNGVTANALSLTSGPTTVSQWTSNSETAMYLQFTSVNCTSLSFDVLKTQVANVEKALGYMVISDVRMEFDRIPAAKGYQPTLDAEEVVHRLSDGKHRIQKIGDSWVFDIQLSYITESFRNELRDVYNLHAGHIYVPFGTATGWDGICVPVVWQAPFDFYRHSDNAPGTGFEGSIRLLETTP